MIRKVAFLILLCAGVARADQPLWRTGKITMSDGTQVRGEISLADNLFYLNVEGAPRRVTVTTGDISKVETMVEQATMEKKWIFKEQGRDEKVYTGEQYPVELFTTKVTFSDGKTTEGHVIAQSVFLRIDSQTRRLTLPRKIEGKTDQKLDDLVYLKSVEFDDLGGGVMGVIRISAHLPLREHLVRGVAINLTNESDVEAEADSDAVITFSRCMAGRYNIAVMSDRAVYVDFDVPQGGAVIDKAGLDEIAAWAAKLNDFFQDQTPIYGVKDAQKALVLVRMERKGGMSLKGAALLRRYEVWLMRKKDSDWRISKRYLLNRQIYENADQPRPRLEVEPALVCDIGPDKPKVELDFKLAGGK